MASYEELSNSELRKKLLDFGYDLPVSINRDFLLKKLKSASEAKVAEKSESGLTKRKSVAHSQNPSKNNTESPISETKSKNRIPPSRPSEIDDERSSNKAWPSPSASTSNSQQSHRYSAYLNYFKGNDRGDEPGASPSQSFSSRDGYQSSYTRQSLPSFSYTYHTPEQSGNSFSNSNDYDNNVPQSSSGERIKARVSKVLGAINPVNWARYVKQNWISSTTENTGGAQGLASYSQSSGSAPYITRFSSTPSASHLNNGHWSSVTPGSRLYSPAIPPGRQAGFKSFFSKQKNGFSDRHNQNNTASSDWENSPKISKILVAILIVFFVVVGVLYVNQRNNSGSIKGLPSGAPGQNNVETPKTKPTPAKVAPRKANYAICGMEGVDNLACIAKENVKGSKKLFELLKEELVQRAKWKGCGTEVEDKITLQTAKNLLYRLSDMPKLDMDSAFRGMVILCNENPSWDLAIEIDGMSNEDKSSQEVLLWDNSIATISAVGVTPNFSCWLMNFFYNTTVYVALLCLSFTFGYGLYKLYGYYQNRKKSEEAELFDYVERIIDLLYLRYEQVKDTGEDSYLAVSHIRDQLVPPKDRQRKLALWTKVVNYISANESRVREEIQHISGEEYRVWRWLPSASPLSRKSVSPSAVNMIRHSLSVQQQPQQPPSPQTLYPNLNDMSMEMSMSAESPNSNNKWQGQAFEISDGSVNALPVTPTTCLKIRQMFDTEVNSVEPGQTRIDRAIIEKCNNSRILHIGVDSQSKEGCVYVKCQTREDARNAYMSLHGWWFDGHLLSVKFLREERYVARFPESRQNTVPLTLKFHPQQSSSFNARVY